MDESTKNYTPPSPQVVHYEENEIEIEAVLGRNSRRMKNQLNYSSCSSPAVMTTTMATKNIHHDGIRTTAMAPVAAQQQEYQQQEEISPTSIIGKRDKNTFYQKKEQRNHDDTTTSREDVEEEAEEYLLYEPLDYRKDWSSELQMTFFTFIYSKMDFDNDSSSSSSQSISSVPERKRAKTLPY